jgi:hypothetical protein
MAESLIIGGLTMTGSLESTQLFSSRLLAVLREREQAVQETTLEAFTVVEVLLEKLPGFVKKRKQHTR